MPGNETIHGRIEKKKHWIARARDFQEKNNKLRHLRRKAEERNPDEFHFHMTRSQVGLDGIHRDVDLSDEDTETQKLLGDVRDLKYVRHKLSVELKKIEKLKSVLHFPKCKVCCSCTASTDEKVDAEEGSSNGYLAQRVEKEKRKQYSELAKRVERAEELRVVLNKIELKRTCIVQED
uniref:Probable U3 small nucleolar RNA-associated protein 11 n=1 Tax=Ditylenchus dipsaci TaxID=166011 RepID=A0A915DYU0_9BILA